MLTVTLTYNDGSDHTRVFNVYGASAYDVDFQHVIHQRLNGGVLQTPVGYRYKGWVDFAPVYDKEAEFWLQTWVLSRDRSITFDWLSLTRDVTLTDDEVVYDFFDSVSFANGLKVNWKEKALRTITDDTATRVLKPSYAAVANAISGDTLTFYSNLVDDSSIRLFKSNLKFIDGSPNDLTFAFSHKFLIDFGVLFDSAHRDWLLEFCLYGSKQIDTTLIDPVNGDVYDVVFTGDELVWDFEHGVYASLGVKLSFVEKTPRTVQETFTAPVPAEELIFDQGKFDQKVWG